MSLMRPQHLIESTNCLANDFLGEELAGEQNAVPTTYHLRQARGLW